MDKWACIRKIANPQDYPGVVFGHGVILYGRVKIEKGTRIGDYCVLGAPMYEQVRDSESPLITSIGSKVFVGAHAVVYNGAKIKNQVIIDEACSIGCESVIGGGSRLLYRAQVHWRVRIGERCVIGGFCCDRAVIQNNVKMFGKLVHRMDRPSQPWDTEEPSPVIRAGAFIGFNALVVGGVTVGAGGRVAAAATVNKNVPDGGSAIGTKVRTRAASQRLRDQ